MNYPLAITRNRTALLAVVAAIIALLGGRESSPSPIARRLRNAALALLRPAESAARRLIVIAARGLVVAPRSAAVFVLAPKPRQEGGASGVSRAPAFRLFDRRRRFVPRRPAPPPLGIPRIRSFWGTPFQSAVIVSAQPVATSQDARPDPLGLVDGRRLRLRLDALERALADLPRQARRLARWRGRSQDTQGGNQAGKPGVMLYEPLRPGRPPGWRSRPDHAVDHVLRECHALALHALDTS